ncbi:MAG: ArsR family transcriptional regulator [Chitinophagaceae bacterium]|nr:MAG: ArsR family transcriptional regulator [Chitinophagaceae bacterium]
MQHLDRNASTCVFCRQLSNPTKLAIVRYLAAARFATASVVHRNCGVSAPTASKYLRAMTEAGVLVRTKLGTCIVYELNPTMIATLTSLMAMQCPLPSSYPCIRGEIGKALEA